MSPDFAASLLLLAVIGCHAPRPNAAVDWQAVPPGAEGLSADKLTRLQESLAGRQSRALLVARHGRIVLEWYSPGVGAEDRHALASLSKSLVGGMALLLALDAGLLRPDDSAASLIPRWRTDSLKRTITLRQLATHSSGLEDAEQDGRPHDDLPGWKGAFWAGEPDPFTVALTEAPVVQSPGTGFVYSNPGYAALAYALTAAFHQRGAQDLRAVLRDRLMRPLGIPDASWSVGYGTSYHLDGLRLVAAWGGGGYTARAVARVGQFMLERGTWGGTPLVGAQWIDTILAASSIRDQARAEVAGSGAPMPTLGWYSNAWGGFPDVPRDAVFGVGAGHQVLAIIPSLGLVVVRLGRGLDHANEPGSFWDSIHRHLLAPLMEAVVEPPYPPSEVIRRIEFAPESTIVRQAVDSDNWPITWARDGSQFTAYGDGWGFEPRVESRLSLGFARIEGDPRAFTGLNVRSPTGERSGNGPDGPKASGLLAVNGVLYLWVRNLHNAQLAWSTDHGESWEWGFRFDTSFGAPTFLQFGPDYRGARDDYVYVYSHDGPSAYQAADGVILARVRKDRVRDRDAYEFFARLAQDGDVEWTRDLARRAPVLRYPGHALRTDAVYHPGLDRYLLALGLNLEGGWAVFDAPAPWGPWSTAFHTFQWDLGRTHGYRLPSKWIGQDGTMFVVFSGHARPDKNYDAFAVRRMALVTDRPTAGGSVMSTPNDGTRR